MATAKIMEHAKNHSVHGDRDLLPALIIYTEHFYHK